MNLLLALLIPLLTLQMQPSEPFFHLDFENDPIVPDREYVALEDALYKDELLRWQFKPGLTGRALDLTRDAVRREPVRMAKEWVPTYGKDDSFAVQIWVKTLPGAPQGTPLLGNKKADDTAAPGWMIHTLETGAWAVHFSDGQRQYDYRPTASRQAINDGQWHHLLFSYDRSRTEVRFYWNGVNVAIYHMPDMGSLESELDTMVGGSDEYFDSGSAGQWTAFNGTIDEVSFWNRAISGEQAEALYAEHFPLQQKESLHSPLRTMSWNIWHGGNRYGTNVGVERVIEVIRKSNADIIGVIETYGSGEVIADALGYHFYLISSNLSIMSRFPIKETIQAFQPFRFGGAVIDLGEGRELAFLNIWIHWLPTYLINVREGVMTPQELIEDEGPTRLAELTAILTENSQVIDQAHHMPVIMMGDFNSGSHLDWIEETKDLHRGYAVEWPVSKAMEAAGFKDSFRELHKNPLVDPGFTWTPRAATSSDRYPQRDRIDYIYYKGQALSAIESRVIDYHPVIFPSDHAAVFTVFTID